MNNKNELPKLPNVRYVSLEGKEMHTFEEFYKDQVNRLIPYYKWERGGNTKFALECIYETYAPMRNQNLNIATEALRRLDNGEYD
jgi:hypothetical protein